MQRHFTPHTVDTDLFWNTAKQVTLLAKLSMSQAGSVCDLHSHMPSGVLIQAVAEQEVLCCSERSPWSNTVTQRLEVDVK